MDGNVFEMEGKECEDQERLKMCRRKFRPERGSPLAWDRRLCLGQRERFMAAARNTIEEKGE